MQHALVVEDHRETRGWMVDTLARAFPGSEIAAVGDVAGARERISAAPVNLAWVDLNLPDGSGTELIGEITALHPDTYCVVATIFDDDEHIFAALKAGAHGYVLKEQPTERIVELLRGITRGEPPLSPVIARRILRHFSTPETTDPKARLSEREREVLTLVGKGYSRGEIARLLDISINTAASYAKTVYRKLNVSSRAEAALEAVRMGLIGKNHY